MVKTKCSKCGYSWDYKGNLLYSCCPRCMHKTKINDDIDAKRT